MVDRYIFLVIRYYNKWERLGSYGTAKGSVSFYPNNLLIRQVMENHYYGIVGYGIILFVNASLYSLAF